MKSTVEVSAIVTGVIVFVVVMIGLGAFVTQWAWNVVMPYAFGLPQIEWYHGFALNILGTMLLRSTTWKS